VVVRDGDKVRRHVGWAAVFWGSRAVFSGA
jgi:hypothetical protein